MSDTINTPQPDLLARLEKYLADNRLNNSDLGRELGCHSSAVSKYRSGKPEGNLAAFESVLEDVLKAGERRKNMAVELFDCASARAINGTCELIRKTNDIGLIHGPAGVGKTCGILLYLKSNPSAVHLTMARWRRSALWVERMLFASVESRNWAKKRISRAEWLLEKFTGSNRLIILDNAHRLTVGGLEYVFDFHDETGCPIALIGNPEILDAIKENDQQFSRIGLRREIKMLKGREVATAIIRKLAPDSGEALLELGEQVVNQRGHMRALKKNLGLAVELRETEGMNWVKAFRASHEQQVRDYALEG